jgi:hypothetical protein
MWTTDAVYLRTLEMMETFKRMPAVPKPRQPGNSALTYARNLDLLEDVYQPTDDEIKEQIGRQRIPPSAPMIRRAEEMLIWINQHLKGQPGPRRCLMAQAFCATSSLSLAKYCRKRGWSRATVYRRMAKALQQLTDSLNENGVQVEEADIDNLEQVRQVSIPRTV